MLSLSNVEMVEQNLTILFSILDQRDQLQLILIKEQYPFYVTHLTNYLEGFDKDQMKLSILCKVISYVEEIFNYIIKTHIEDEKVPSFH